jgi:hypothetical protein
MPFVLVLLLATVLLPHSSLAADLTDDPGGFDGIRWGTRLEEIPDLQLVKEGSEFKVFQKPIIIPVLCDTLPEDVKYHFYKDRFESVTMIYRGKDTHAALRACAGRAFGRMPVKKSRMALRVDWEGPLTVLSLTYDASAHEGRLSLSSRALAEERFYQLELSPSP